MCVTAETHTQEAKVEATYKHTLSHKENTLFFKGKSILCVRLVSLPARCPGAVSGQTHATGWS